MVTTSPEETARREASCGLSASAFPHTCLVSGFGHSCSQALLAKLPSHTQGSGRKTSVSALPASPPPKVAAASAPRRRLPRRRGRQSPHHAKHASTTPRSRRAQGIATFREQEHKATHLAAPSEAPATRGRSSSGTAAGSRVARDLPCRRSNASRTMLQVHASAVRAIPKAPLSRRHRAQGAAGTQPLPSGWQNPYQQVRRSRGSCRPPPVDRRCPHRGRAPDRTMCQAAAHLRFCSISSSSIGACN